MMRLPLVFARCQSEGRAAAVAFTVAGYPTQDATVEILLAMQRGGIDIVELGLPSSDPIGDGPIIQDAHAVALQTGCNFQTVLDLVGRARERGLVIPVVIMGYCNPVLQYGFERAIEDASRVEVDGFLLADLPVIESVRFGRLCREAGISYIPVISPTMQDARIELLCQAADTYIYVLSRMGVTGSTGESTGKVLLSQFLQKLHRYCGNKPLALGLGVSTREQFVSMQELAPGVVVGTQIIKTINGTPADGDVPEAIQRYCMYLTGRSEVVYSVQTPLQLPTAVSNAECVCLAKETALPSHFGPYGGQFVPELLLDSLEDLEKSFMYAQGDPSFWRQYESHLTAIVSQSEGRLQIDDEYGMSGPEATLWQLKDSANSSHSPARYRLYSTLGQVLLACRLGKKRILNETTCEGDAVATATLCARLGLHCVLFIGARDLKRFPEMSARIDQLGGTLITVSCGGQVVRDAINAALQYWIADLHECHYVPSLAIGPHPYPTIVRTFQARFGTEMRDFALSRMGKSPDVVAVNAAVGDAAVAMVPGFMDIKGIDIVLIEPFQNIVEMSPGVFHGSWTEVQQDKDGQVPVPSDPQSHGYCTYPALEPELSHWISTGKARLLSSRDTSDSSHHNSSSAGSSVVHAAKDLASQHQQGQNILAIVS